MITRLEWDDNYSVGVEEIDAQHRVLFNKVNDFLDSIENFSETAEVAKMLAFLEEYVVFHFDVEEKYMSEHGYPRYAQHAAQHKQFIETVAYLKEKFLEWGTTTALEMLLQSKLVNWIVDHVLVTDKKFGAFLAENVSA